MLLFLRNWLAVWQLFCGKQCVFQSLVPWWLSLYYWYSEVSLGVTKCGSSWPLKSSQILQLYISPHCPPSIFLYICKNLVFNLSYLNSLLCFLFYSNSFRLVKFILEILIPYSTPLYLIQSRYFFCLNRLFHILRDFILT